MQNTDFHFWDLGSVMHWTIDSALASSIYPSAWRWRTYPGDGLLDSPSYHAADSSSFVTRHILFLPLGYTHCKLISAYHEKVQGKKCLFLLQIVSKCQAQICVS